jgi:hypothetical protein
MIVHRLMQYGPPHADRYYLEASPIIPIDSEDFPNLAVVAAVLFAARTDCLKPIVVDRPLFNPGMPLIVTPNMGMIPSKGIPMGPAYYPPSAYFGPYHEGYPYYRKHGKDMFLV